MVKYFDYMSIEYSSVTKKGAISDAFFRNSLILRLFEF
jgi:hypothetical protein